MNAPTADAHQAQALQSRLSGQGPVRVDWVARTDSTNSALLQWARTDPPPQARCLVAGHQSAGRGRAGRTWLDDGTAVLCSLAWPLAPRAPVAGLSLAVGVWLGQALRAAGAKDLGLKWPNDLLLHGRKLAGVLVEVTDTPQARWAVIGFGLNLHRPEDCSEAAGLDEAGLHLQRWDVLDRLLPNLCAGLTTFARQGFAPWVTEWNALHVWAQRMVQVLEAGQVRAAGVALGVDEQGYLRLQDAQEHVARIASGDVSLRPVSNP